MIDKEKILAGRKAVDAYREAHRLLHSKPWRKTIPEEHTPLLIKLVDALERLGFTSAEPDFEPKKTEILAKFWDASDELNLIDTGIFDRSVRQNRQDLSLITGTTNPQPGVFIAQDGLKVEVIEWDKRTEIALSIDGERVTDTFPTTHFEMETAVSECPNNARVFVGGLGLGVVLLYLANSGKAVEVMVCEIDDRVISTFGQSFRDWFHQQYPTFTFSIIQGNALREVTRQGKFDWIFFDLTKPTPEQFIPSIESALAENGVYSDWWEIERTRREGWWH